MCGLIFHKDPSTGLHTLMALVSPLKIERKYHMPWIGFMNGMSHYYLGGPVTPWTFFRNSHLFDLTLTQKNADYLKKCKVIRIFLQ